MWKGYKYTDFEFEGRSATIVFPEKPDALKNWTLKMEYQYAFIEEELALLERGFHVAFLSNTSRFASKADCDAKARFAEYLHREFGLRDRCVPIGMSLGGAHAVNFAGFYPEKVACMYIDAPILSFFQYAKEKYRDIWENEVVPTYPGITRAGLYSFDNHPMAKIPTLRQNRIPVLLVYGNEDMTVPVDEHAKIMEMEYENCPGLLTVMVRNLQGHHPHGFPANPAPIADYIVEHSK